MAQVEIITVLGISNKEDKKRVGYPVSKPIRQLGKHCSYLSIKKFLALPSLNWESTKYHSMTNQDSVNVQSLRFLKQDLSCHLTTYLKLTNKLLLLTSTS